MSVRALAIVAGGSAEAQLESRAFLQAARSVGMDTIDVPLADIENILDGQTAAIVIGETEEVVVRTRAQVGLRRTFLRTSGLDPLRVFRPFATLAYRHVGSVLMRSQLEVAELGDRPFALLPSAASLLAADNGARCADIDDDDPEILVLTTSADPEHESRWVELALSAAAEVGVPRLMAVDGEKSAARQEVHPFDKGLFRRGRLVVAPLHDTIALAEILGSSVVVLDVANEAAEFSTPWVRDHRVAATADELQRHLTDLANGARGSSGPLDDLCRFRPFEGTIEDLGRALLAALGEY
jgi:hypothetical protein